jgi:hypothetical protein
VEDDVTGGDDSRNASLLLALARRRLWERERESRKSDCSMACTMAPSAHVPSPTTGRRRTRERSSFRGAFFQGDGSALPRRSGAVSGRSPLALPRGQSLGKEGTERGGKCGWFIGEVSGGAEARGSSGEENKEVRGENKRFIEVIRWATGARAWRTPGGETAESALLIAERQRQPSYWSGDHSQQAHQTSGFRRGGLMAPSQ